MYPTFSEHDYQFILQDAGVQYVFAEDATIVQKVLAVKHQCGSLKSIISFERTPGADYFWDLLPANETVNPEKIEALKNEYCV
jgi:long-subunit acyl-CoA synthetase (AMP-forming)